MMVPVCTGSFLVADVTWAGCLSLLIVQPARLTDPVEAWLDVLRQPLKSHRNGAVAATGIQVMGYG